jgi:transposase-like protein
MNCPVCKSEKIKKLGFYRRKRNHRKIQRFKCKDCGKSFSNQTFAVTYKQKRPDLNSEILESLSIGVGIRKSALNLRTTKKTIQRKIKYLALLCDKFNKENMPNWTRVQKPQFVFDEMETIEESRVHTIHIPTLVEKESSFILNAEPLYASSRSHYPYLKVVYNEEHKDEISKKTDYTKEVLKSCRTMKPEGRIVIYTDDKPGYAKYIKEVFGDKGVHLVFSAWDEEEKRKLFPVNNAMACMRAEKAMLRKTSWYICKNKYMLSEHLKIYMFYYNYFRKKGYTVGHTASGTKIIEYKTPAQHLGIFDKVIEPKTLVGF